MNIVETVSIKKNCSNMCGILPISDITFNVFKKVAADICLLTANTLLTCLKKLLQIFVCSLLILTSIEIRSNRSRVVQSSELFLRKGVLKNAAN